MRQPQSPHRQDCPQHAVLFPAPARCRDLLSQAKRRPKEFQAAGYLDILHQGNVGKATHGIECSAPHENRLVAGSNSRPARTQVHHRSDQRQNRRYALDSHIETPPVMGAGCEAGGERFGAACGKSGVRMQEKQDITFRSLRPGVHLTGPPAWCVHHQVAQGKGSRDCRIRAAAIHHDHLRALLPQCSKLPKAACDNRLFVQNRDDDRQVLQLYLPDWCISGEKTKLWIVTKELTGSQSHVTGWSRAGNAFRHRHALGPHRFPQRETVAGMTVEAAVILPYVQPQGRRLCALAMATDRCSNAKNQGG